MKNDGSDNLQARNVSDEVAKAPTAAPAEPTKPNLDQKLSGAVRQAITDVMKDGKRPDLPDIDMDFVVGDEKNALAPRSTDVRPLNVPDPSRRRSNWPIYGGIAVTLIAASTTGVFVLQPFSQKETGAKPAMTSASTLGPALKITSPDPAAAKAETAAQPATPETRPDLDQRQDLEAKLEASRTALAAAEKRASEQRERSTASAAQQRLLQAELEAKRAALAEADRLVALQRLQAAEQRAATEAERLLLEAKRAAVEEAERRIALQQQAAAEERAAAEAERLLLEAKRAAVEEAEKRIARQREEASKQKAAAEAEQQKLAKLRAAQPSEEKNNSAQPDQDNLAALRAAEAEVQKRLADERAAIERLRKASEDLNANKQAPSAAPETSTLQPYWADEEKARLRLEQLLIAAAEEARTAATETPTLREGPKLVERLVTLRMKNSNLKIAGELKSHDEEFFVIVTPTRGEIKLPMAYFDCTGKSCPAK